MAVDAFHALLNSGNKTSSKDEILDITMRHSEALLYTGILWPTGKGITDQRVLRALGFLWPRRMRGVWGQLLVRQTRVRL